MEKDKVSPLRLPSHVSQTSSSSSATITITIPDSPPPCSPKDFPDVTFWTRDAWNQFERRERAKGRTAPKLGFLTQPNGDPTSSSRISTMGKEAHEIWNTLYREREDPEVWGAKTKIASEYFSNSMRNKFPEFRWCEGDWKVEAFGTIRFPDWCRYTRSSGHLKSKSVFSFIYLFLHIFLNAGTNPSFQVHGKRKIDDHVTDSKKLSRPTSDRPTKKQKASLPSTSASPPVDSEVIVIDFEPSISDSSESSLPITATPSLSSSVPPEDNSPLSSVCYFTHNLIIMIAVVTQATTTLAYIFRLLHRIFKMPVIPTWCPTQRKSCQSQWTLFKLSLLLLRQQVTPASIQFKLGMFNFKLTQQYPHP